MKFLSSSIVAAVVSRRLVPGAFQIRGKRAGDRYYSPKFSVRYNNWDLSDFADFYDDCG